MGTLRWLRVCDRPSQDFTTALCVFVVLVTLSAVGCHGVNPAELEFTRAEPARVDVVGKWIPTPDTLKETKRSAVALVLRDDGSFSVVDLPMSLEVPGVSRERVLSGSGIWRMQEEEDGFRVWVIHLDFASHHRETFHLRHQRPPYLIHIYLDDPDTGDAMLLERVH
jgi:hypothetical protein